ncbi:protein of unknown function [Nitrospira japonica]|uniref:Uncharacterized protein n=1 Tax=Nitrospira japonica TaxID=1325564 RepID=A0A1W1IA34_9BACT|nr:protein of unknown function [Nitrospira japonica]
MSADLFPGKTRPFYWLQSVESTVQREGRPVSGRTGNERGITPTNDFPGGSTGVHSRTWRGRRDRPACVERRYRPDLSPGNCLPSNSSLA